LSLKALEALDGAALSFVFLLTGLPVRVVIRRTAGAHREISK
jgi:hypothetical protein